LGYEFYSGQWNGKNSLCIFPRAAHALNGYIRSRPFDASHAAHVSFSVVSSQVSPFPFTAAPQLPLDAYLSSVQSPPPTFSIEFQTSSLLSIGIIMPPSNSSCAPLTLQPELLPSEFKTIALHFPVSMSFNAECRSSEPIALSSNGTILKSVSECITAQHYADTTVTLSYNPSRTLSPFFWAPLDAHAALIVFVCSGQRDV
jgi:hypothetical protein